MPEAVKSRIQEAWPALPYEDWKETCETLHLWMQIVGKVKVALSPFLNEFWHTAFHLTARGLTTGTIPYKDRSFDVRFDFIDDQLLLNVSNGQTWRRALEPCTVATFYSDFMNALSSLDIEVKINPVSVETPQPIRCDQDTAHSSYDPEYVRRFLQILLQTDAVLQRFRSDFVGKSSPIHFFWGSFDLAHTRFSGRRAPMPEGPLFYKLSEDQENFSCGFWPGNPNAAGFTLGQPAFYAYAYPEPAGFRQAPLRPDKAKFNAELGEPILLYEDARKAANPGDLILEFFRSVYDVAADLAQWDRSFLERKAPARAHS